MLLFLTRGEMTESMGPLTADEVAAARIAHAKHIAGILDCEVHYLDLPDTRVEYSAQVTHRVAKVVAEIKPDAVITWGHAWLRGMRHPDHQVTGDIVRAAITVARIKRAVAPVEPHRAVAPVFTLRDRHSQLPCAAIDVSPYIDQVLSIGRFYHSQVGWPDDLWLRDRLEQAGKRWGVAAAEEFDAWESVPGLRRSLLGDYLAV